MVTLISILLVLLALIPMLMAHRDRHIQLINHELEDDITSLNSSLMAADMDYQEDILYYNSDDIWNIKLLDEFIKRLKDKGHQPLSVEVKFKDEAAKADFIATAKKMVEERYIAFTDGSAVILLFSDVEEEEIKQIFQSIGVAYTALKTY